MRQRLLLVLLVIVLLGAGLDSPPVRAQGEDACTTLVSQALASLDQNCTDTQRDQVCYGHNLLTTEFWEAASAETFTSPSDKVAAREVRSIGGSALEPESQLWGLGLMRLQADIPDTLPGQAVTFLLVGDVEVQNAVSPDQVREPVTPINVTATAGVNLRSGPGANFGLAGSVSPGTVMTAIGRSAASDWVQVVQENGQRVWVTAQYVRAEGDLSTLPAVTDEAVFGPMQAFYFRTGLGSPACEQALPDHILVDSPEGLSVSFNANGVRFTVGSTAALRSPEDDQMTVTTFKGQVVINVELPQGGEYALTIPAGLEADVPLGTDANGNSIPVGAPQNFRPLDRDEWRGYEGLSENFQAVQPFTVPEPPSLPTAEELAEAISGGQSTTPTGITLGTGDVQATLIWDNLADMDLIVIAPNGEQVYFGNRQSPSGGTLDIDSNFPCGRNVNYAENIFWPTGRAPSGTYRVVVNQYSTCGAGNAHWTLTVRVGGAVVLTQTGTGGQAQYSFTR